MTSVDYLNQLRDQITSRRSKKLFTRLMVSEKHTTLCFTIIVSAMYLLSFIIAALPIIFFGGSVYSLASFIIITFLGYRLSTHSITNVLDNLSLVSQSTNSIFLFFQLMKKQNIIIIKHHKLYTTYLTNGLTDRVSILEEAVNMQNWMDEHLISWWIISPDIFSDNQKIIYIFGNEKDAITFKLTFC